MRDFSENSGDWLGDSIENDEESEIPGRAKLSGKQMALFPSFILSMLVYTIHSSFFFLLSVLSSTSLHICPVIPQPLAIFHKVFLLKINLKHKI
jgi:hypothetical protein